MVLQEGIKLPIWGHADPGEAVSVSVGHERGSTTADATGHWRIDLDPLPPGGGPLELEVHGAHNDLKFSDVLAGEVWLFTGQSNMGYTVGNMPDAAQVAAGANNPQLRYFVSGHQIVATPADDCPGQWEVVSPENVNKCSAVAYFTSKDLAASGHGPVGMIVTCWGGLGIQSFMGLDALKSNPAFQEYVDDYTKAALPAAPKIVSDPNASPGTYKEERHPPNAPTLLYNGMIHPVMPYGLKGFVWFHGASNTKSEATGKLYYPLEVAMIREWRRGWGEGDLPFIIEQINPVDVGGKFRAEVRNSQLLTLSEPNTGLSVSIDIGEKTKAHFADKSDIGYRISLAARELAYGEKIVGFGPIYQSATTEGNKMRVSFTHTGSGLKIGVPPPAATGGVSLPLPDKLADFEIAGPDGKWVPADARIDGDTVVVSAAGVADPKAVRYAWSNFPEPLANLYNKEGLPASPFASNDR
jgi:sialate O-acetylesterase